MRKFSWMLLVFLPSLVHAADEKAMAIESMEELKGITAKKIIWKKDRAVMISIPARILSNLFGWALPKLQLVSLRSSWNHQATKAKTLMIQLIGTIYDQGWFDQHR